MDELTTRQQVEKFSVVVDGCVDEPDRSTRWSRGWTGRLGQFDGDTVRSPYVVTYQVFRGQVGVAG